MDCLVSWGNHGIAGVATGHKLTVHYKRKVGRPLCGDRIIVNTTTDRAWIEQIQPRSSRFARADRRGRPQWIAANPDQIAIIVAAEPAPSRDLIDRYLAACELLQIKPLLVLQKTDLDAVAVDTLRARLETYTKLGYDAIEVSAQRGTGMRRLKALLASRRTLFSGQSGVGKSTLISALIPDLKLQTRALSVVTGKGTHTTSTACMYYLPAPIAKPMPAVSSIHPVSGNTHCGRCRSRNSPEASSSFSPGWISVAFATVSISTLPDVP